MTPFLLDANVVIALLVAEHEHHERASEWFADVDRVALCPIVEGALLRFLLRTGESRETAHALLAALHEHPRVDFWTDELSYRDLDLDGVRGHGQLTDVYLAGLAAARDARLATLDVALARLRPSHVLLIAG
jgi:toxin-antitoxin system PIN domain toxin